MSKKHLIWIGAGIGVALLIWYVRKNQTAPTNMLRDYSRATRAEFLKAKGLGITNVTASAAA